MVIVLRLKLQTVTNFTWTPILGTHCGILENLDRFILKFEEKVILRFCTPENIFQMVQLLLILQLLFAAPVLVLEENVVRQPLDKGAIFGNLKGARKFA